MEDLSKRIGILKKYPASLKIPEDAGFLTNESRTFMKTTLNNRLASSKKAYDNIYKEYGRRINKVTGRTDGTDYITDYSRAFEQPDKQIGPQPNPFQQSLSNIFNPQSGLFNIPD